MFLNNPAIRAGTVATVLSAFMLATHSGVAAADHSQGYQGYMAPAASTWIAPPQRQPIVMAQASDQQGPSSTTKAPSRSSRTRVSPTDRVETRIKDLHAKLHITQDQDPQWNVMAQTMRDNARAIDDILKKRSQSMKTMSAVDDLSSYQELAQAHADGLKKLVTAFEALYASMSDQEKKNADTVFRNFERQRPASRGPAPQGSNPPPVNPPPQSK